MFVLSSLTTVKGSGVALSLLDKQQSLNFSQ